MAVIVLLGGVRSGKSQLASRIASDLGAPVVVIATGEARDDEMAERIEEHRRSRPRNWTTVEEPLELGRAISHSDPAATIVVDCLTLWVSNLMERGCSDHEIEEAARGAIDASVARPGIVITVSNEVGWGLVPANALGRRYRDVLGRVNSVWVGASERALLLVAGRAVELPPEELTLEGLRDG
jgi:adenosylcobinamide kinase / adenosylcobinamide-phosphate guanylyltransferase